MFVVFSLLSMYREHLYTREFNIACMHVKLQKAAIVRNLSNHLVPIIMAIVIMNFRKKIRKMFIRENL